MLCLRVGRGYYRERGVEWAQLKLPEESKMRNCSSARERTCD